MDAPGGDPAGVLAGPPVAEGAAVAVGVARGPIDDDGPGELVDESPPATPPPAALGEAPAPEDGGVVRAITRTRNARTMSPTRTAWPP